MQCKIIRFVIYYCTYYYYYRFDARFMNLLKIYSMILQNIKIIIILLIIQLEKMCQKLIAKLFSIRSRIATKKGASKTNFTKCWK